MAGEKVCNGFPQEATENYLYIGQGAPQRAPEEPAGKQLRPPEKEGHNPQGERKIAKAGDEPFIVVMRDGIQDDMGNHTPQKSENRMTGRSGDKSPDGNVRHAVHNLLLLLLLPPVRSSFFL